MSGVLNFTMGLNNGGFMGPLGGATAGMSKMIGVGTALAGALGTLTGLAAGFGGVWREIGEGDRLGELSARTKTSAKDLAMLEHAFNDVGVGSGSLAPMLLQLQKSLGGVNEQGEPTNATFAKLGLSINELKGMNAPAQIDKIGAALKGLGKEEATALAGKILSKGGAGDMLQIARQTEDFGEALSAASARAEILARNAAAFGKISSSLGNLKIQGAGFFAGIAEGAAPGIQMVLNKLKGLNLTGVGERIGQEIGTAFNAFKGGELGEMISLSLSVGFQKGAAFAESLFSNPKLWSGMGSVLVGALAPFGKALLSLSSIFNDMIIAGVTHAGAKALELIGGPKAPEFKDLFAAQRQTSKAGMEALLGTDKEFAKNVFGFLGDGFTDLGKATKEATEAMAKAGGVDLARLNELRAKFKPKQGEEDKPDPNVPDPFSGVKGSTPGNRNVNSLERLGLVVSGRAVASDYARRSAIANERVNSQLERTNRLLQEGFKTKPQSATGNI